MMFQTAVIISLLFAGSKGNDNLEYDDEYYQYDDFNDTHYDDLDSDAYDYKYEYNENDYMSVNPVFVSEETKVLVDRGNTARLVCRVDHLGGMLISWRKLNNDDTTVYISMGDTLMVHDRRVSVSLTESSSTLTLALLEEKDTGIYLCEVSSKPPLVQKHRVEIRSPSRVEIVDIPESREILLTEGDPLQLNCQGFGDPAPSIYWSRANTLLPDGSHKIDNSRLEYRSVGGKHAGTYVCTGDNGFGQPSKDAVHVLVKYAPEILLHDEFTESGALELVCVVKGYPEVSVSWTRGDRDLDSRVKNLVVNGKHILSIPNPNKNDIGIYTCTAENTQGIVHAVLDIQDSEKLSEVKREETVETKVEEVEEAHEDVPEPVEPQEDVQEPDEEAHEEVQEEEEVEDDAEKHQSDQPDSVSEIQQELADVESFIQKEVFSSSPTIHPPFYIFIIHIYLLYRYLH